MKNTIYEEIVDANKKLKESSTKKPTVLWTFYHSLIVIELALVVAIEGVELWLSLL